MRIFIFLFFILLSSKDCCACGSSPIEASKILEERVDRVLANCKVGLSRDQLIQAFRVIEEGGKKKYSSEEIELPCAIEWSEVLQGFLIRSIRHKDALIGGGYHKKVSKVILYGSFPKVLAECLVDRTSKGEIEILESLRGYEGIIPYYGCVRREKRTFLYLEFFPQKSLEKRFRNKLSFSEEQIFKISLDITKGVKALHERGLVHRDLHEGNILLDITQDTCRAVLIDFGLTSQPDKIRDTTLQGSYFKSPPEGLLVKLSEIDRFKADVYALGCLFYQLVYGKHPPWASVYNIYLLRTYSQEERLILYRQILSLYQESNDQNSLHPLTPLEKFKVLMYEMMSYDPGIRPSIEEVLARLENL